MFVRVLAVTALAGLLTAGASANAATECGGGVAPNPSVEEITASGQPAGYTFESPSYLPPGTPADQQPRLFTDTAHAADGTLNAVVSTSTGRTSTAYETIPTVVPLGTYHLSVRAGTHDISQNQPVGLRFYDAQGRQVAERSVQADHDIDTDGRLGRFDLSPTVAPAGTAMIRFFAATDANWVKWDCVRLTVDPPDSRR